MVKYYHDETTLAGTMKVASQDPAVPAAIRATLSRVLAGEQGMAAGTPDAPTYSVTGTTQPRAYWFEVRVAWYPGTPYRQRGELWVWDGRSANGRDADRAAGVE